MELFAWMLQEALDLVKTENASKREAGRPISYRPILTVLDEGSALKGRGVNHRNALDYGCVSSGPP